MSPERMSPEQARHQEDRRLFLKTSVCSGGCDQPRSVSRIR